MSYHFYQTEGVVLSGRNIAEAGRFLSLFTEELGLVKALVQGARKLESKLRFHLENYTYGQFTLVRGREMWRLVGAQKTLRFKDPLVARICLLLERLVRGEEKDQNLFQDIRAALLFLEKTPLRGEARAGLETILVLRIIDKLGYLKEEPNIARFVSFQDWEGAQIEISQTERDDLARRVNQALKESQL